MMKSKKIYLNPLESPICLHLPRRNLSSAWMEHIPFAFYLMDIVRPDTFVELGTFYGVSYCAFCQAVDELELPTRCFAVDTWAGDVHMGGYDKGILGNLRQHHDPLYGGFSTLLQSTFDDALGKFEDGTIDLLHIDGCHTYEAVKHDFEIWMPKLSRRGVIIFHDTNEYKDDFGVWRFFDEIKKLYPHFEFFHGHGLGIAAVGEDVPAALSPLLETPEDEADVVRNFFYELGQRISLQVALAEKEQTERNLLDINQSLRNNLETRLGILFSLFDKHQKFMTRMFPKGSRKRRLLDFVIKRISLIMNPARLKQVLNEKIANRRSRKMAGNLSMKQTEERLIDTLRAKPLFSVVMPTYNTPARYLKEAIRSVQAQRYPHWELLICDDGSTNPETLETLHSFVNEQIKIQFQMQNQGISAASNRAVENARGEYLAFLDHDDILTTDALLEMALRLNEEPESQVIYSDQDKIDQKGKHQEPFLKPDWSPEYFRSVMYVGHLLLVRKDLFIQVGGFDSEFDGVQDYEFMLRVAEHASRIAHIPKILYHWRMIPGSVALGTGEKGKRIEQLQVKAITAHMERAGVGAEAFQHPIHPHRVIIRPTLRAEYPKISILVSPVSDTNTLRCLESIFTRTTYPNYEVFVLDQSENGVLKSEMLSKYPIRVIPIDRSFKHAVSGNIGVNSSTGELIVFINGDLEVTTKDWLEQMAFYMEDPNISITGPMIIKPDLTVYCAGLAINPDGFIEPILNGSPCAIDGPAGMQSSPRNVSAVSSDCLMIKRRDYFSLGGFVEYYEHRYYEVDLCFQSRAAGKKVIYVPYAMLTYHGDAIYASLNVLDHALFRNTWDDLIVRGDPYYRSNSAPNLPGSQS